LEALLVPMLTVALIAVVPLLLNGCAGAGVLAAALPPMPL